MLFSDLPAPIPGTIPSAIIRLYAGQTGISEGYNDTDLIDVRGLFTPIGSGAGGGTGAYDGSDIILNTTNFNHNLSAADDNVQKALDTLDELIVGGSGTMPGGSNTGDFVRFNAGSGNWEVAVEPIHLKGVVLTPAVASLVNAVGAVYFDSVVKALIVCTDV
jgi:hypothetical protein